MLSRTLGTPNNDVWPDVESLPDYKNTFPKWKSGNLSSMVKNLDKNGLDLLAVRTVTKDPIKLFFKLVSQIQASADTLNRM